MRLPRPNIPVSVRLLVAQRQAVREEAWPIFEQAFRAPRRRLQIYLNIIRAKLDCDVLHLDHDPALVNRKKVFRNGKHVDYSPRAADPHFLIIRAKSAHDIKTRVRGEHGQHSDLALRRKNKRIEAARRGGRLSGSKIPSRPFPKRKVRLGFTKGEEIKCQNRSLDD